MAFRDSRQVGQRVLKSLLLLCLFAVRLPVPCPAQLAAPGSASNPEERFTLNGIVVNSATGEPIARALVRLSGMVQRTAFSDGDGRFQIDALPAGQADIVAQKPGYFSRQELEGGHTNQLVGIGPSMGTIVVKLTPQGAIYGRITDSAGEPLENVPVRLTARNIHRGHMRWASVGYMQTDEDGKFRIANLMPGTYYLAAGPSWEHNQLLPGGGGPKTGYSNSYYPGVSDLASASPIRLAAGQQAQADLSLNTSPLFHVNGTVTGYPEAKGFNLQFFSSAGDRAPFPVPYDPDLGTFHADKVPAGSYLLKVSAQVGTQSLQAETRLNVAANVDNVRLALAPAISIPVMVTKESRAPHNQGPEPNQGPQPFSVTLVPSEPSAVQHYSIQRGSTPPYVMELQNVDPGKYAVDVIPRGSWYVHSAKYGQTNLLTDPMIVAPGQAFPMEVVLRDDSATLTGAVKSSPDGVATAAAVIAVLQPSSSRSAKATLATPENGFTISGLPPGDYLLYALEHGEDVEYSNPEALQPYASQATKITLAPNQSAKATLSLIHTGGGE